MKWDVPDDLPIVVANADGVVEGCPFCGGEHHHGPAQPDSDFQRAPGRDGRYFANSPTRRSHCEEYSGDYLLAFGLGEDHPYLDDSAKREYPDRRNHDAYKEDHWRVLDIDGVDNVFSTPSSDDEVRLDLDGQAAPSMMRDLADEGDNVNISAWLSLEDAEKLRAHLSEAIDEAKQQDT